MQLSGTMLNLAAAADGADVDRGRAELRVRPLREFRNHLRLDQLEHAAHGIDGVESILRRGAVAGNAGGFHAGPEHALVRGNDAERRGLKHQREVTAKSAFRHGMRAFLASLLAH